MRAHDVIATLCEATSSYSLLQRATALVADLDDGVLEPIIVNAYGDFGYSYPPEISPDGHHYLPYSGPAHKFTAKEFVAWAEEAMVELYSNPFASNPGGIEVEVAGNASRKAFSQPFHIIAEEHGLVGSGMYNSGRIHEYTLDGLCFRVWRPRRTVESQARQVVYLVAPDPEVWEPAILSLVGQPLMVLARQPGKVIVKDPEDPQNRYTFKDTEVARNSASRTEVSNRYHEKLATTTTVDPDEGARPSFTPGAATQLETAVGNWVAFGRPDAKRKIIQLVTHEPVLRTNSLRTMYADMRAKLGVTSFAEFLKTPITLFRGSNVTNDNPISVTWDPSKTSLFGGGRHPLTILPAKITFYIGGPEREVFVPRGALKVKT